MLGEPASLDPPGWNEALLRAGGSFLQSFQWGEFQRSQGREVVRLESGAFQAQLIRHPLPLGMSYLYCPRGPVMLAEGGPSVAVLADFVQRVQGLRAGAVLLKIEPQWPAESAARGLLETSGFVRSNASTQPTRTIVLDLSQPEEAIFGAMRKGRRYDIRLAERKGVSARRLGQGEHEAFLQLLEETARRDRFRPHPYSHYRAMLEFFQGGDEAGPFVELWGAEYEGQLLATSLLMCWGGRAIYLHAASSSRHRDVMAPAFLHWQVVKEVKRRGFREYDLWGVSEAWPGVSQFKRAFGGTEIEYVGSYELALRPAWYRAYALLRRLRYRTPGWS